MAGPESSQRGIDDMLSSAASGERQNPTVLSLWSPGCCRQYGQTCGWVPAQLAKTPRGILQSQAQESNACPLPLALQGSASSHAGCEPAVRRPSGGGQHVARLHVEQVARGPHNFPIHACVYRFTTPLKPERKAVHSATWSRASEPRRSLDSRAIHDHGGIKIEFAANLLALSGGTVTRAWGIRGSGESRPGHPVAAASTRQRAKTQCHQSTTTTNIWENTLRYKWWITGALLLRTPLVACRSPIIILPDVRHTDPEPALSLQEMLG